MEIRPECANCCASHCGSLGRGLVIAGGITLLVIGILSIMKVHTLIHNIAWAGVATGSGGTLLLTMILFYSCCKRREAHMPVASAPQALGGRADGSRTASAAHVVGGERRDADLAD